MKRMEEEGKHHIVHTIARFDYTISEQQDYILSKIKPGKKADFKNLFLKLENRIHAIVTFLALLELLNMQKITIIQGLGVNNFWVTPPNA